VVKKVKRVAKYALPLVGLGLAGVNAAGKLSQGQRPRRRGQADRRKRLAEMRRAEKNIPLEQAMAAQRPNRRRRRKKAL